MIKNILQIAGYAAIVYFAISLMGNAHDRGYIEGCKDTRVALSEYLDALVKDHSTKDNQ